MSTIKNISQVDDIDVKDDDDGIPYSMPRVLNEDGEEEPEPDLVDISDQQQNLSLGDHLIDDEDIPAVEQEGVTAKDNAYRRMNDIIKSILNDVELAAAVNVSLSS